MSCCFYKKNSKLPTKVLKVRDWRSLALPRVEWSRSSSVISPLENVYYSVGKGVDLFVVLHVKQRREPLFCQ